MSKPDTLMYRSKKEKAGLEHHLFHTGQLTCISKINLARYTDEHMDGKLIVVAHSGKTIDMPMVLNLVNKSCLLKMSIDKTSILLVLDMTLESDMSSKLLKIDMCS